MYLNDIGNQKRGSVYTHLKKPEMKRVILEMCNLSLNYYIAKYPYEFKKQDFENKLNIEITKKVVLV